VIGINCFLKTWYPLITIAIILGSALLVWFIPERIFKKQILSELLREYRSTEMGIAINRLWSFAQYCLENDIRVDEGYNRIYNSEKIKMLDIQQGQNTLHMCRRKVSQFYQQLSTLNRGRLKKFILRNFSTGDFRLIRIVYTIERYGLEKIITPFKDAEINKIVPKKLKRKLEEKKNEEEINEEGLPEEDKEIEIKPVHNSQFKMLRFYLKSKRKEANNKNKTFCEQRVEKMLRHYAKY